MAACLIPALSAQGQFRDDPLEGEKPANVAVQRWRIGMLMTAQGSGFRRVVGTITVPTDWPEQRVRVIEEDLSSGVSISYQTIEDTARQMVIKVPALVAGQQSRAVVTFEIRRLLAPPPEDPTQLALPDRKRLDRGLRSRVSSSQTTRSLRQSTILHIGIVVTRVETRVARSYPS